MATQVISIAFKADRAKGAPELNGRSFTFEVSDDALRALASKMLSNTLNNLVKGTPARAAMSVEDAVRAVETIARGGKIAKNTRKAQAVGGMLSLPSDMLRLIFNAQTRDVKEDIVAELTRRGETDIPELPPVRERKARS